MSDRRLSPAETVERMIAAHNAGDYDTAQSFIHPDAVNHGPPATNGVAAWRQSWEKARAMFPTMQAKIESTVSEGDLVCHRFTLSGTAANGKPFSFMGLDMVSVKDGQVIEHWALADFAGLNAQIAD
jgi:predicted ester cyclase